MSFCRPGRYGTHLPTIEARTHPGTPGMLRRRRADGGDAPEPAGAEPVAGEPATDRMGAGAAPEQQNVRAAEAAAAAPVLDADGELVPTPTFIQEIIALHPMAYATVSARMIAGSGSLTLCLILHCAYLLLRDEDDAMTPRQARGVRSA